MNKIILGMIAIKACWDMIHLISCHHLLIFQSSYQPMMTAYYCETWYIFAVIVWMMWSVWVIDKDWGSCGCVTLPHSSHLRLRPGSPLWPPRPAHASVRRRPQTALSGAQGRTLWRPADQRIMSWTWQLSAAECLRVAFFMLWNVCVNLENISPGIQEINVFCLQLKLNMTIMEVLPPRRGVICAATDSTQGVLHRK